VICELGLTLLASVAGVQLFAPTSWLLRYIAESWWNTPFRALNESLLQHVNWAWVFLLAYAMTLRYAFTKF